MRSQRSADTALPLVSQIWQLASRLAAIANYEPGSTIYKQHDPPDAFYVVLHGTVEMQTEVQCTETDRPSVSGESDQESEEKGVRWRVSIPRPLGDSSGECVDGPGRYMAVTGSAWMALDVTWPLRGVRGWPCPQLSCLSLPP